MAERFLVAFALGLLAPVAFILGAEPFTARGRVSVGEVVGGSVAVVLYSACCQFWIAQKENRGLVANWPNVAGMAAPGLGVVAVMLCVEQQSTVITQGLPLFFAGCIGVFLGVGLARRGVKTRR